METLKADLKEELGKKLDDVSKRIEENNEKINTKIDGEITGVRREIAEVHEKCEQYHQELTQTKEEIDGRINKLKENTEVQLDSMKKKQLKKKYTKFGMRARKHTRRSYKTSGDVYKRQAL